MTDKENPPLVVGNDNKYPLSKEGEWNKQVFDFIENRDKIELFSLFYFLRKNNLPIKTSWVFYCLGKAKNKNCSRKAEILNSLLDGNYYSEFLPELYYWNHYRYSRAIPDSGTLVTYDFDSDDFIKECWEYVDDQMKNDEENRLYEASLEAYANAYEGYDPYAARYCGSCNESPCMCSDPERTSTTYGE
jgi:hypothetical protein